MNGERAPDWHAPELRKADLICYTDPISFKRRSEHIHTARKRRRSESWV